MKKFITLLTIGFLLFPAIGEGYQRRVDRVRGRNGRVVQRHRYSFRGQEYRGATNSRIRQRNLPGYGGWGCSPYQGYRQYRYPGIELERYNMMQFYSPRYYVNPYYNGGKSVLEHWKD